MNLLYVSFSSSSSSSSSEIMHHWSSRTNINTSIVHEDSRGKLAILWTSTSRASVYMCVTLSTPLSLIVIQSSCLPFSIRHQNDNEVFCLIIYTQIYYLNNRSHKADSHWRCVAMILQIAIIVPVMAFLSFLILTDHVDNINK